MRGRWPWCCSCRVRCEPGAPARGRASAHHRPAAGRHGWRKILLLFEPEMATLIGQVGDRVRRAAGAPENAYRSWSCPARTSRQPSPRAGTSFSSPGCCCASTTAPNSPRSGSRDGPPAGRPSRSRHAEQGAQRGVEPGCRHGSGESASPRRALALAESCQSLFSAPSRRRPTIWRCSICRRPATTAGTAGVLSIERSAPVTASAAAAGRSDHRQVEVRSAWLGAAPQRAPRRRLEARGRCPVGSRRHSHARAEAPEAAVLKYRRARHPASPATGICSASCCWSRDSAVRRRTCGSPSTAIRETPCTSPIWAGAFSASNASTTRRRPLSAASRSPVAASIREPTVTSLDSSGDGMTPRRRSRACAWRRRASRTCPKPTPNLPTHCASPGRRAKPPIAPGCAAVLEGRFGGAPQLRFGPRETRRAAAWQERIAAEMAKMR